jgi:hypothetical protein
MSTPSEKRKCSRCGCFKLQTVENFKFQAAKQRWNVTCLACSQKGSKKNSKANDNIRDNLEGTPEPPEELPELTTVSIEDFLAFIAMDEEARLFSANVDASVMKEDGRDLANAIAKEVYVCIDYRFV